MIRGPDNAALQESIVLPHIELLIAAAESYSYAMLILAELARSGIVDNETLTCEDIQHLVLEWMTALSETDEAYNEPLILLQGMKTDVWAWES